MNQAVYFCFLIVVHLSLQRRQARTPRACPHAGVSGLGAWPLTDAHLLSDITCLAHLCKDV